MLRSSVLFQTNQLPPPNIDSRPKVAAFQPQPQTNFDILNGNLFKPYAQSQPNTKSQTPARPMSCMSSINLNDISQLNSNKVTLNEILNTKGDKFIERINAMLQNESDMQAFNQLNGLISNKPKSQNFDRPYSSISENIYAPSSSMNYTRPQTTSTNVHQEQQNDHRASSRSLSNFNNYESTNKQQTFNDFHSQIHELSNKNSQAQQKLKQIQSEHGSSSSKEILNGNDKSALDKLKMEQQMLKDQIDMLNKQRESASYELEILAMNSMTSSNSAKLSEKSSKGSEYNFIDGTKTPSLSPIRATENHFQEVNRYFET